MSPDDAPTVDTQSAATEDATVAKRSMKDRMAFLGRSGDSLENVPGINRIPRSMRVLAILVFLILIVAVVAVAWPSGEEPPAGPSVLDPARLEDFDFNSGPLEGEASEFQSISFTLDTMLDTSDTILIDRIEMVLTWQDEEDRMLAGRTRENTPDEFMVTIDVGSGNITVESEMVQNDAGSRQGIVSVVLDMSSQNHTYILYGNATDVDLPDGVLDMGVDLIITMGEAGNYYASGPALLGYNDLGNAYTLTVTVEGKVIPPA